MPDRALVIAPTYNERENIDRLIDRVLMQDSRIDMLIVDDGSPDGTGEVVDTVARTNERVHVIHRERKLGLGTAYVAGFRWALERDYEFIPRPFAVAGCVEHALVAFGEEAFPHFSGHFSKSPLNVVEFIIFDSRNAYVKGVPRAATD